MSLWSQCRLIDILSHIDLPLVEEEFPEGDLDNAELCPDEDRNRRGRRRIAVVSGVAAGSIALTGAVMFVYRKYGAFRKAG